MNEPNSFQIAEQIKGFLDPEEGRRLYELALEAALLGPCLEIGSYCGKSTIYLGAACQARNATLFSVDHHRGSEEQQPGEAYFDPALFDPRAFCMDTFPFFRCTLGMAGLEQTVAPLVCTSQLAAKDWATLLGLVFIDGGHAYDTVLGDYQAWWPHVLTGGYLLIHDIFTDPSRGGQAPYEVYRLALASGNFTALPMTGTLGVLQRV